MFHRPASCNSSNTNPRSSAAVDLAGSVFAAGSGARSSALYYQRPGTPGDGNWEDNIMTYSERHPAERIFNAQILDLNYGLGARIQLTYEVPYLVEGTSRDFSATWDAIPFLHEAQE
jgi:hypothetical protein